MARVEATSQSEGQETARKQDAGIDSVNVRHGMRNTTYCMLCIDTCLLLRVSCYTCACVPNSASKRRAPALLCWLALVSYSYSADVEDVVFHFKASDVNVDSLF